MRSVGETGGIARNWGSSKRDKIRGSVKSGGGGTNGKLTSDGKFPVGRGWSKFERRMVGIPLKVKGMVSTDSSPDQK